MLSWVTVINSFLNQIVWGTPMLLVFLLIGVLFTIQTRFFQVTHFSYWMKATLGQLFHGKAHSTRDKHAISQFQSLCTALASTLGTGNIAGVATAIVAGGPGAVFWMWVSAFLGMMTHFAENVLGIKYRYRNQNGEWCGGAFVYMEKGLGSKFMGSIFAFFCILASFGMGNMTQSNSIAQGLFTSFHFPPELTACTLIVLISLVLLGGIKRVAAIASKLIPFLAILYTFAGLLFLLLRFDALPSAFASIFQEAFRFSSVAGGTLGYGFSLALQKGISRGVFSNEAGLGSSTLAHCASDVKEPVEQGMWGILEVFLDTIVMCTITALVILTSGVYSPTDYLLNMQAGIPVLNGTALTSSAFSVLFPFGDKLVSLSILLFAFSTLLGWSYYGEKAVEYLWGSKAIFPYKIIFLLSIYIGCTIPLELVWGIADTLNGFMAVPNLLALFLLSKEVSIELKRYRERWK